MRSTAGAATSQIRSASVIATPPTLPASWSADRRWDDRVMRTPLCDRLGIEFPIFAFSHCRDVVAAVTRAGGFGVLGAVAFSPEELEVELDWIDDHVGDKPYGVDIIVPAKYTGVEQGGMTRREL